MKECRVRWLPAAASGILLLACPVSSAALPVAQALREALRGSQATAVVLESATGETVAAVGSEVRASPGSAIKPLLLEYALEHGIVRAETEVYCRRNLKIGNLSLPCTHPRDSQVFTAESALAESCNTWFAALGSRFSGPELEAALRSTHLPHANLRGAEAVQRQLAVLGLRGVTATPLELARAYRELLAKIPAGGPVALGLRDSVAFGMANPASVAGLPILGKTGTAGNAGETWTHGWFAGELPGRFVVAVYVPQGDGGDAARLARRFFVAVGEEKRR